MGSMWLDEEDDRVYPMADVTPAFDPTAVTGAKEFPLKQWGSDYRAMLVMIEFMGTDWRDVVEIPLRPKPTSKGMMDQLEMLVTMQKTERAAAMEEILAQNRDFQPYMVAQLGISPRSHPITYLMLKMSARVGEMVMIYLKNRYGAGGVRPSQFYPLLFPPVPVPGHASYPSGHSLVSHMIAYTAATIVPAMGTAPVDLARRIGRNREVAGLHYPIDTQRGAEAAYKAFGVFQTIKFYGDNLSAAKAEWAI